ncbi:lactate dehydrogenase B [Gonapodya prolifera JEL478]|uniref:L-lactate dehydrogenase n=1 Tax=Gonapodya prolifera (strain JEL478) TaxID=1344416 RepID=A0A139AZD3_GONPJ|nr:lactate dehydrogenase B [Gonapodya prolifera JEL478]|eukprot:KXS21913.1 lactate dehydrogenase B [Gonapodya prolifera JEL478]
MVKHSRIAIVGAGSVGAAIAYACMLRGVPAELVLVDIVEDAVRGQVLDLSDASFVANVRIRQGSFQDAGQADIIIITAGAKQKPGESRIELIARNNAILKSCISSMSPLNPHAIMLIVANPVDVLTALAQRLSGLPPQQVFGSGTFLDSERLRVYIADKLKVSETSVHAFALGEHGDSQFIAWSAARVGGVPVLSFPEFKNVDLNAVQKAIARKAYEIISLKGATYFGIGACCASLCLSILNDTKSVRPLSVYSEKHGVCYAWPCVVGKEGIQRRLDLELSQEENAALEASAKSLKEILEQYA